MVTRTPVAAAAAAAWAIATVTAGCGVLGGSDEERQARSDTVQAQTDAAMVAILDATLERLDLRSTTGSRNFTGCVLDDRYDVDLQLAGAYADQPALRAQTAGLADAATAAGFDVTPGREPGTLQGDGVAQVGDGDDTVALELYLSAPPRRSDVDDPVAGGGLRTLSIRTACFDAGDDAKRDFGVQDFADAIPPDRVYDGSP